MTLKDAVMNTRSRVRSIVVLAMLMALAGCGGGANGGPDGSPVSAAPTRHPGAPDTQGIALSADAASATRVAMRWDGSTASGDSFQVYRNGELDDSAKDGPGGATDSDLKPGTQYCYQVTAVSSTGGGAASSNQSCVTTAPLAGWNIEMIDQAPPLALALDPQGMEHVGYCGGSGVTYQVHQADGSWSDTLVDPGASCFAVALGVGGDGSAYMIYLDQNSNALKYAVEVAGNWGVSSIPGAEGAEFYSLAVDSGGHAHVVFELFTGEAPDCFQIVYATNSSGSWQAIVVADAQAYPVIAVDAAGMAHIAFLGDEATDGSYPVRYLTDVSGVWTDVVAANSADPKSLVALAVDGAGHAHLVYKSQTDLEYASDRSGTWQTSQVDSFSASGPEDDSYGAYDVSIALDASGLAHMSYEDTSGNLKYASPADQGWGSLYVDTVGTQNVLRLDAAGHAHIAYGGDQNLYSNLAVSP
jgi:hypothetical protein